MGKIVRITGKSDEARAAGAVFYNGHSIPLGAPVELDDMAIEHIRQLSNYKRLNIDTLNEYQVLEMLEQNDPTRRYTLEEAMQIKMNAQRGDVDVRLTPLQWIPEYAVEVV